MADAADITLHAFDLDAWPLRPELLSTEEAERVARKARETLRRRQAASFCALRVHLGRHLDRDPAGLAFVVDEHGKPHLAGPGQVHFNLSHSGPLGLLAIAPFAVGVDVERLIRRPDERLAREILHPRELEHWLGLDAALRQAALTRAWSRKEAVLKAVGTGIRVPPASVDVGLGRDPADPVAVDAVAVPGHGSWGVRAVDTAPEARAAVAWRLPT